MTLIRYFIGFIKYLLRDVGCGDSTSCPREFHYADEEIGYWETGVFCNESGGIFLNHLSVISKALYGVNYACCQVPESLKLINY